MPCFLTGYKLIAIFKSNYYKLPRKLSLLLCFLFMEQVQIVCKNVNLIVTTQAVCHKPSMIYMIKA
jgi:hypothetical protein